MGARGKPTYVLGTGLSHDGSSCLMKDGRICVAIEKERLTRQKHDGGNDTATIDYCLAAEGITIDDVALVVQNDNFSMFERGNGWFDGPRPLLDRVKVVTISHHLAHAYSAIGTAPFGDGAAILVIDGCGNAYDESIDRAGAIVPVDPLPAEIQPMYFEKDSYYLFKDNRVQPVFKDYSPYGYGFRSYPLTPNTTMHSIGGFYSAASKYALYGMDDPGKLMGLAPYGKPGVYTHEGFDLRDGRVFVRYEWMKQFDRPTRAYEDLHKDFQYYADFAYWVQREVERALLYVARHRHATAPSDQLAYGGGVALNAVANRLLRTQTPFRDVYMQPAASDNGLAIGCAYYGWMAVLEQERVRHDGSTSFGKTYAEPLLSASLAKHEDALAIESHAEAEIIARTAALLAEGKTVGWFHGGSEFGPRSLGHRSILADPRKPGMRDHINTRIKKREDFRPFAPSVPLEDVSIYFDCDYESPYMIITAPVRPDWADKIPNVVHRDKSCRIQTVTRASDPRYYDLLHAFKAQTGISVLLNTSFNRRGMPIVETPEEAVDFFLSSELDVLVLEDRIITKRATDPAA